MLISNERNNEELIIKKSRQEKVKIETFKVNKLLRISQWTTFPN